TPAAQPEPVPPPRTAATAVIVPVNVTRPLQMSKKQVIKEVRNEKKDVVRVQSAADDPRTVLLTGLKPGTSRVTLVDNDNKEEVIDVVVQIDVEYLNRILRESVPTASVRPLAMGEAGVILTGTV